MDSFQRNPCRIGLPCLFPIHDILYEGTEEGDLIGFVTDITIKKFVKSIGDSVEIVQVSLVDQSSPLYPIVYEIMGDAVRVHRDSIVIGCMLGVFGYSRHRTKDGRVYIKGGQILPFYCDELSSYINAATSSCSSSVSAVPSAAPLLPTHLSSSSTSELCNNTAYQSMHPTALRVIEALKQWVETSPHKLLICKKPRMKSVFVRSLDIARKEYLIDIMIVVVPSKSEKESESESLKTNNNTTIVNITVECEHQSKRRHSAVEIDHKRHNNSSINNTISNCVGMFKYQSLQSVRFALTRSQLQLLYNCCTRCNGHCDANGVSGATAIQGSSCALLAKCVRVAAIYQKRVTLLEATVDTAFELMCCKPSGRSTSSMCPSPSLPVAIPGRRHMLSAERKEKDWLQERQRLLEASPPLSWDQFIHRIGSSDNSDLHKGCIIPVRGRITQLPTDMQVEPKKKASATDSVTMDLVEALARLVTVQRVSSSEASNSYSLRQLSDSFIAITNHPCNNQNNEINISAVATASTAIASSKTTTSNSSPIFDPAISHYIRCIYRPQQLQIGPSKTDDSSHRSSEGVLQCTVFDQCMCRWMNYTTPLHLAIAVEQQQLVRESTAVIANIVSLLEAIQQAVALQQDYIFFMRIIQIVDENDIVLKEVLTIEDILPACLIDRL